MLREFQSYKLQANSIVNNSFTGLVVCYVNFRATNYKLTRSLTIILQV